jgi:hypothetical protein
MADTVMAGEVHVGGRVSYESSYEGTMAEGGAESGVQMAAPMPPPVLAEPELETTVRTPRPLWGDAR